MCKVKATNWNGREISLTFATKVKDLSTLAPKAHAAIRKAGFTTYRLDAINGTAVPYALQYA